MSKTRRSGPRCSSTSSSSPSVAFPPHHPGVHETDSPIFASHQTRLVDLQNYSGGVAVLAALNGSSITRLKKTWEVSRSSPLRAS